MRLHPNAKLTPWARHRLAQRVRKQGWPLARAAREAGVSRPTAYKWLNRFDSEGQVGLQDRSSRPHRIPKRTPLKAIRRMERLRRRRKTAWEIALETGIPASTVSRHLKQQGLGRIWRLEEELDPPQRYEHAAPGDLFHIDAKRFARIEGVGHAIHGDRSRKKRGVGWEVAFVCVDDHTRLAYAEVLPAENAKYAVAFFRRALRSGSAASACSRTTPSAMRRPRPSTRYARKKASCRASPVPGSGDSGSAASACSRTTPSAMRRPRPSSTLCEEEGILQSFTRPYTPKTNGKAERFIQTLKRRWAYRQPFRTSAIRAASLPAWLKHYNHHRPHRSLGKKPPMARLRQTRQQRA